MRERLKGNYYDIAVSDLYFARIGIDANLESGIGGYNNCAAISDMFGNAENVPFSNGILNDILYKKPELGQCAFDRHHALIHLVR